MSIMSYR